MKRKEKAYGSTTQTWSIIQAFSKYPNMPDKLIDLQVMWYPEWRFFKIVRLNNLYFLFEKHKVLFHSTSVETVKMELIERFHFTNSNLPIIKHGY